MSEETKDVSSWDDLEELDDIDVEVVKLPATSEVLGRDVFVKLRAIEPIDLMRCYNFPMDEVNRLVAEGADGEKFANELREHSATFSLEDYLDVIESTVRCGLVDPDPESGDISKLKRDFQFMFGKITGMTTPGGEAQQRADFREDGKRASD